MHSQDILAPLAKDEFQFYLPVEFDKSNKSQWKIKGVASTPDKDDQNEVVFQDGLDISHLKKGLGLFNDDHKKGPENIVGQVTDAKKSSDGLHVEGYLFKEQPKAQAYKNIMCSLEKGQEKRVKLSIEGKVLKRSKNKILRAKVTNIALTMNPINENTYAEFMKSFGAEDSNIEKSPDSCESEVSSSALDSQVLIEKSKLEILVDMAKAGLAAGNYNAPPGTLTQGAALAKESLDKKKKNLKKKYKSHLEGAFDKLRKSCPNLSKEDKISFLRRICQKVSKDE